jgi:hypothetical protein
VAGQWRWTSPIGGSLHRALTRVRKNATTGAPEKWSFVDGLKTLKWYIVILKASQSSSEEFRWVLYPFLVETVCFNRDNQVVSDISLTCFNMFPAFPTAMFNTPRQYYILVTRGRVKTMAIRVSWVQALRICSFGKLNKRSPYVGLWACFSGFLGDPSRASTWGLRRCLNYWVPTE